MPPDLAVAVEQAVAAAHYFTDRETGEDAIRVPVNEWSRLITAAKAQSDESELTNG